MLLGILCSTRAFINVRLYRTSVITSSTLLEVAQISEENAVTDPIPTLQLVPSSLKGEYKFVIIGEPVALARHRTTRFGSIYNPSSKAQQSFQQSSLPFLPPRPLEGPVEAEICFYFSRPKTHYRTGKFSNILKPNMSRWFSKKPGECLMHLV